MVSRKIDPADKRHAGIHHHNLAVQAAKPVSAYAEGLGRRVEHLHHHPGFGQLPQEARAQLAATKTVEADHHLHPALGRLDEDAVQLKADLVFKKDEGLQQDLALGAAQCLEHGRKVRLAVLQQRHLVAALPAVIQISRLAVIWRLVCGDMVYRNVHSSTSTDSGTWSDKWDQGRVVSTRGLCTVRLRT